MRLAVATIVATMLMAGAGRAQERVDPGMVGPVLAGPIAASRAVPGGLAAASAVERQSTPVLDRKFWAVAAALNTAMVLDTRSTFDVIRACRDCREGNPFVAPFVRRGPGLTYTAGEVFDAGVMTLAARMRGSSRAWVRRTWWVAPVALIGGHAIAYRHNVNLLR